MSIGRPLPLRPAILGIVLAPFLTIFLSFRHALIVQAILITLFTLATAGLDRHVVQRIRESSAPFLRRSLGLIVFVGLAGALIGLIRGHAIPAVGGQALSILLLPLGAFAAFSSGSEDLGSSFQRGLLEATLIGGFLQLVWGLSNFLFDSNASRLFLPNAVSIVPILPMALLFLLAERSGRIEWKWSIPCLGVLLLLLVLSSLRSLWILTPFALVLLSLLYYGPDLRRLGAILLLCLLVAGCLVGGTWTILRRLEHNPTNLLPAHLESIIGHGHSKPGADAPFSALSAEELIRQKITGPRFPAPESPALLLKAESRGGEQGAVVLVCRFLNPEGKLCGRMPLALLPSSALQQSMSCALIPEEARSFQIRASAWEGSRGSWRLHSLRASSIHSGFFARIAIEALSLQQRVSGLIAAVWSAQTSRDATLSFRITESRKTWQAFASAPLGLKLIGHGLGATLRLDTDGFDNRGHWIHYDEVNYLHNWYLFLLYKLGILGCLAVLFSIGAWMWLIFKDLKAGEPGSPSRAFPAAALASWIVYLVWSLSSPEILDFHMAPLWGFLVAAALKAAGRSSGYTPDGEALQHVSDRK